MVLQDLGRRLNSALQSVSASSSIDEQALDAVLKSVCAALLESDVNVLLVKRTRERVKKLVLPQLEQIQAKQGTEHDAMAGNKAKQLIHKAIFDELVALVDPGDDAPPAFNPVKGKTQVIMMVGLQGAGKTTTCTKLATHYQRRGLKVALVCADTFRAGAFDQLKQNATRAKVPFFGSYTETDPVAISLQGVQKFRSERFDVIIVDTSGRHRQESELFDEMCQIQDAVEPDMTVLVLDGAIGQAAEAQSQAFKEASDFGAIIVTKLDGHAKGGGAISAVAATHTPIIFIGTGEHLHDLEKFSPRPFISKMLGMGDMAGLVERAQEMAMANPERQENMMKKLEKGEFTVRDLKEQMQTIMNMGPLSNLTSMIPGMGALMGGDTEAEAAKRMKRIAFIFDSMTTEELDSDGALFRDATPAASGKGKGKGKDKGTVATTGGAKGAKGKAVATPKGAAASDSDSDGDGDASSEPDLDPLGAREPNRRVLRVARGSGTSVQEVEELLAQHQMFAKMAKRMGGKNGMMGKLAQRGMGRPGAAAGAGGMPAGMPPLGPGGMPDLSKLSPAQMRAMQNMLPPGARDMLSNPGALQQMQQMMGGLGGGGMGGLSGMGGMGGMADMLKGMMGGAGGR
ncbi:putative signal recognition particle 54 kDa protein [Rhodotorula diobovata]|uniref:signal-recognition-particle GTPase n=1 Tax=Rhodotorula diobovata TaxID=5288 RepID=A0A5C5G1P0_9BASI|nr:putative signal recognition particle 54 kDa protein [Rhodotorula diobovata]